MLEFYTEEFKNRAQGDIEIIKEEVKDLLPNILKWQMIQCMVIIDGKTVCYSPIKDENNNQIGTRIVIDNIKNKEKYIIKSESAGLSLRKETANGIIEVSKVFLQQEKLINERIFMFNNDYIIYETSEYNGYVIKTLHTNLDKSLVKDALLDIDVNDSIKYIKDFYFDNQKSIRRIRTNK